MCSGGKKEVSGECDGLYIPQDETLVEELILT